MKMEKVTKEIAYKLYAASEYKRVEDLKDYDYVVVADGDDKYIAISLWDIPQTDGNGDSYWEAVAVKIGDAIDEDGWATTYEIRWYLDDLGAEDGADSVDDWDNPEIIKKKGSVRIEDGRRC